MSRRRFRYLAALIVVLALALRVFYVLDVRTTGDIRGDINGYVSYAWNLKERGVFSSTPPLGDEIRPDSYRGPGYPVFLDAIMSLVGPFRLELHPTDNGQVQLVAQPSTWVLLTYIAQSILGALTVALGVLLARFWLGRVPSLVVGILIAFWPHLIVFCATLLSETLFGFLLIAALVATCFTEQRRSSRIGGLAGGLFGLAYFVNPVIGAFPFLVVALFAFRRQFKCAVPLLVMFALAPAGWALRNHFADVGNRTSLTRAEQNFVEGSWPQYHSAMNSRLSNAISDAIMKAIQREEQTIIDDPAAGLSEIRSRMAEDPGYYAVWYLFEKPVLLWDWGIRVGANDTTFLQTTRDPFSSVAVLRLTSGIFRVLNPVVLFLTIAALAIVWLKKFFNGTQPPFVATLCALFFLYVTGVHDVFQSEPRYAIPYRSVQLVIAMAAVVFIAELVTRRMTRIASSP